MRYQYIIIISKWSLFTSTILQDSVSPNTSTVKGEGHAFSHCIKCQGQVQDPTGDQILHCNRCREIIMVHSICSHCKSSWLPPQEGFLVDASSHRSQLSPFSLLPHLLHRLPWTPGAALELATHITVY